MAAAVLLLFSIVSFAQQNEEVTRLIATGIDLHEKGEYEAALAK